MMIGHLTIAGLAELLVSGGVVAFLQQSDPALLRATSGLTGPLVEEAPRVGGNALRPLWVALGALMILTPVGILAGGSAWGEWLASDYADPVARQQMARSSLRQAPPTVAPQGLERLSSIWTAPFAQYAPPYVRSRAFGYLLSSMFGAGLVMLGAMGAGRLIGSRRDGPPGVPRSTCDASRGREEVPGP
jgi:cobalt/nickel transport system permease protein